MRYSKYDFYSMCIVAIFVFAGGFVVGGLIESGARESKEKTTQKIELVGSIQTKNGVSADVFKIGRCYILLSALPQEFGRAVFQMECQ